MKVNSTVAFTFILLVMIVGSGIVSALRGYSLGSQALKGITQPQTKPTRRSLPRQSTSSQQHQGLVILPEQEIYKQVEQYKTNRQGKPQSLSATPKSSQNMNLISTAKPDREVQAAKTASPLPTLRTQSLVRDQEQGVTLAVVGVSQQSSSLVLNVNLKNEGRQAVQFLYSFLEVTDDKGRSLSAFTEGLPPQLPANGEEFSGAIKIPQVLLTDDARELSLTLTDYPNQELKLQLSAIPIVR